MTENLILVDGNDSMVGTAEKRLCHTGAGRLHRAFTAMLFDGMGRLLLARRSPAKMLWPAKWDGTVASHPREGEDFAEAAGRRLPEELGVSCDLEYLFKFEYHVRDGDRGSENEVCGTLVGMVQSEPDPDPAEIVQVVYAEPGDLDTSAPFQYCPWMLAALALLPRVHTPEWLAPWTRPDVNAMLHGMVSSHMSTEDWRLVS